MVELYRSPIDGIQLGVCLINTDGGVDGQGGHKFFPSLCEDPDELEKSPFPNGPRKELDDDLFPDTTSSGNGKLKPSLHSLEICVASVRTFPDVLRHSFTELLHPSLDCLTIGCDLLGIFHIF